MSMWKRDNNHRRTKIILRHVKKDRSKMKLNQGDYQSLISMMESPDIGNHIMVYEVLKNLDSRMNMIYLFVAMMEMPNMSTKYEWGKGISSQVNQGYKQRYTQMSSTQMQQHISALASQAALQQHQYPTPPWPGSRGASGNAGMTGISGFPSDYLEQDPGIQPAEWDDLRKVLWTELKEIVIQNSALFGPIYPGDTHWRFTGYFLGQLLHLYPEDLNFVMSRILTEKTPTYYQTAQWHYEFLTTLTFNLKYDVEYERQPGETCEQP